jgi:phage shock protein PspC (stress-responsive transcriptional regulator)
MNTMSPEPETTTTQTTTGGGRLAPRDLRRNSSDKLLGGVASGLARYVDADVTLVRIVFAVLSIMGGVGVPLYIACWLLIPEDGADEPIAAEYLHRWQGRSR